MDLTEHEETRQIKSISQIFQIAAIESNHKSNRKRIMGPLSEVLHPSHPMSTNGSPASLRPSRRYQAVQPAVGSIGKPRLCGASASH
jgi:hypothetical protein